MMIKQESFEVERKQREVDMHCTAWFGLFWCGVAC